MTPCVVSQLNPRWTTSVDNVTGIPLEIRITLAKPAVQNLYSCRKGTWGQEKTWSVSYQHWNRKNLTNSSSAFLSGSVCGMDSLLLSKAGKAVGQCKSGSMSHSQAARIEPISVEDLDKAGREILVHVQRDSFNEEISIIKNSSANIIKGCAPTTKKIKSRSQVKSPGLTHSWWTVFV